MSDAARPWLKRSTLWRLVGLIGGGIFAIEAHTASVHAASVSSDVLAAAHAAYVQHDYAKEAKLLRPLAEQGNATAQALLGFMYGHGQGLQQDDVEALRWYRKAAEQGDAGAQSNLRLLYVQGRGAPQDFGEAVKWFRKSADQDLAFGQNNLGAMYARGLSMSQNYAEATKWYGKAAEQGYPVAQFNLGQRYSQRLTENELSDFSRLWHDGCVKAIIEAQNVDQNHSAKVWTRGAALRKRCHGCGMGAD